MACSITLEHTRNKELTSDINLLSRASAINEVVRQDDLGRGEQSEEEQGFTKEKPSSTQSQGSSALGSGRVG